MIDAARFAARDTLRDGTPVTIRAVRSDDRDRIARAFRKLDRETVYTRFFTYKDELGAADLARLDAMDFVRHAMLVVTIGRRIARASSTLRRVPPPMRSGTT